MNVYSGRWTRRAGAESPDDNQSRSQVGWLRGILTHPRRTVNGGVIRECARIMFGVSPVDEPDRAWQRHARQTSDAHPYPGKTTILCVMCRAHLAQPVTLDAAQGVILAGRPGRTRPHMGSGTPLAFPR